MCVPRVTVQRLSNRTCRFTPRTEITLSWAGKVKRNLVDGFFKSFTGFEAWFLGRWDFQGFTGLRVTAGTGRTISDGESAEAYQYNRVASLESASDGFDYSVQRTASSSFRDVSGCGDGINQFRLVHSKSPYIFEYF